MARSVWKGPYVPKALLKKIEVAKESGNNRPINIWWRRAVILPNCVGMKFGVYNGRKFEEVNVTEEMVGHKFGEFSPTRTYHGHGDDKKKK